jgi:hypothetical protein
VFGNTLVSAPGGKFILVASAGAVASDLTASLDELELV